MVDVNTGELILAYSFVVVSLCNVDTNCLLPEDLSCHVDSYLEAFL